MMLTTTVLQRSRRDATIPLSQFSLPLIPQTEIDTSTMPLIRDKTEGLPNIQNESTFFRCLPGELRNQIYDLAMTSEKPIIDPSMRTSCSMLARKLSYRTEHRRVPDLSTQLLWTCKRMHQEIAMTSLYARNTFRFTTPSSAHNFLSALPQQHRELIEDVEIDLREVQDGQPPVEREWIQYLSWNPVKESLPPTDMLSLQADAPNVKTLRLSIECWRVQETMWSVALLKEILKGPRDLQRVVMTGIDGSELLFGSRDRYLEKWGPVAFVGVMRFARLAGMTDWMADAIEGEAENKVVVWEKRGPRVSLEMMTRNEYRLQTGRRASSLDECAKFDPLKGACSLKAYERRWHSGEWPHGSGV